MVVQKKKCSSILKKRIHKNIWKRGILGALKAFLLAKSFSTGTSKSFLVR
ncbi:hypothetical protein ACOSP7_027622 [Xanthoceras sorbifolium]